MATDSDSPTHTLLAELHTDLHACCVETVDDRLFLCGLYELNEEEQVRNGQLVVCDTLATLERIGEADAQAREERGQDQGIGEGASAGTSNNTMRVISSFAARQPWQARSASGRARRCSCCC